MTDLTTDGTPNDRVADWRGLAREYLERSAARRAHGRVSPAQAQLDSLLGRRDEKIVVLADEVLRLRRLVVEIRRAQGGAGRP